MLDRYILSNAYLSAAVKADGAELCSLKDAGGTEMLWQAGSIWPRHAPILFPIVGRLKNDTLRHNGRSYRMGQHGFARDRRFAWLSRSTASCRLVLHDDTGTRAQFPFAFRLEVAYTLDDDSLETRLGIRNTGREMLPVSAGAHPGFAWPLSENADKTAHFLEFAEQEPAPVRRLRDGLLLTAPQPSPVDGHVLPLHPDLFAADALIFDQINSRSVRYTAPGAESIEVSWEGFNALGVWSRAGADFVCIEPWRGTHSPENFDGELLEKPGLMLIPPGEERSLAMRIRIC